ncbi:tyrosine-type recombinase/integrase [Marivivens donghaensis]|uniref:Tyrosine-type recombinase/integrase n=1 Tax=Marivivens donghaensis TaxID=1699413 RepID=A0ABX0VV60_9RHOB|nr:tyrosine-type recombinase/integrase [Marivivens donghaensis]NIY71831.1 tyrosine-type recombinase/integrase [Marivivens donghaensis]
MKYIEQPRGPNTAYRFKMKTPEALRGKPNPWREGKLFGKNIILSMDGERHLPTARKLRDQYLGEIRSLEMQLKDADRFSVKSGEMWAELLRNSDDIDHEDESTPSLRSLFYDEIERAPKEIRDRFGEVGMAQSLSLRKAVEQYIDARRVENPFGYKPLTHSAQNELKTAIRYLCDFMEKTEENLYLDGVSKHAAMRFRGEYLGVLPSKQTGKQLSRATIDKLLTMLRGLWVWAIEHRKLPSQENPFVFPKGLPRAKVNKEASREVFRPEETTALLAAAPQGDRIGDLFRIGLVCGARISELAKVTVDNTAEDGGIFHIDGGKTVNAKRAIPVPTIARPLIQRLRAAALEAGETRLFFAFPLDPKTGSAKAASQAFTRLRRDVLGEKTDGRLTFHSLRHTWKTASRRAGLSIDDAHDLGGWASVRRSSNPYDHGLNNKELAEAQEKVCALLLADGQLEGF